MSMNNQILKKVIFEEVAKPAITDSSIIYCDMDGVLVDFATGAIELANSIISGDLGQDWMRQSKSMRRALRDIQLKGPKFSVKTPKDLDIPEVRTLMFAAISFDPGAFFSKLPPLQDGISTLWPFLTSLPNQVVLLTAPVGNRKGTDTMTAGEGKKLWAQEWLKPAPSDVIISRATEKPGFASSGDIVHVLIDDKASTIRTWNETGYGILHVTGDSQSTIARLGELL